MLGVIYIKNLTDSFLLMHNYATHVYMYSVHTLQNLKIKLIKKNGVEVGNGEKRDINTIHYIYLILIQDYAKGRGLCHLHMKIKKYTRTEFYYYPKIYMKIIY